MEAGKWLIRPHNTVYRAGRADSTARRANGAPYRHDTPSPHGN
ncbi:MAG: hypothetical protein AAFQ52_15995 [Chloroflexota bacterium]